MRNGFPPVKSWNMRPAYFPQSGYKHEPSALPNWGLVLQKKDETQSVRSELPIRCLEVPKWREWKGRLNRSLRMKSEVLEINLTGHLFLRRLPPLHKYPADSKEHIFQTGPNYERHLSAGEINRSINKTLPAGWWLVNPSDLSDKVSIYGCFSSDIFQWCK